MTATVVKVWITNEGWRTGICVERARKWARVIVSTGSSVAVRRVEVSSLRDNPYDYSVKKAARIYLRMAIDRGAPKRVRKILRAV